MAAEPTPRPDEPVTADEREVDAVRKVARLLDDSARDDATGAIRLTTPRRSDAGSPRVYAQALTAGYSPADTGRCGDGHVVAQGADHARGGGLPEYVAALSGYIA